MTIKFGYERGYQQGKADAMRAQAAEIKALRADAERYRFLRSGNYSLPFAKVVLNDTPHGIDRAVDTEMEIWQPARPDAASGTTGTALESLRAWNAETDPDVASALDDLTKSRGST